MSDSIEVQLALAAERLRSLTFLYSSLDKRASDAEVVRADQARQIQQLLDMVRKAEDERSKRTIIGTYLDNFRQETWGGKVLLSVGPVALFVGVFMATTGSSLIDIAQAVSLLLHGSTQ